MNWFCIQTKPLKESQVVTHLRDTLDLETYFPLLRRNKTIRRVRRVVTSPLFPRYLFCRFDPQLHYRAARYAPDVIGVVSFGGGPAVVNDAIIEELKNWAGDAVNVITIQPDFRAGDLVEVTDGPMRGLQAVIMSERSDRDRVAVLLSILECQAHMIIHRDQLRRVG